MLSAQNPLAYETVIVTVVDAEDDRPMEGALAYSKYEGFVQPKGDSTRTDANGQARIRVYKDSLHAVGAYAEGYAPQPVYKGTGQRDGHPSVFIRLGRLLTVDVELILPDDVRPMILQVVEGEPQDAPPAGLEHELDPRRIEVTVGPRDLPPPLPQFHPAKGIHLQLMSPHKDYRGLIHRVTAARTRSGTVIPVHRSSAPPDGGYGLYLIGISPQSGAGNKVFVLGTHNDALAAPSVEHFNLLNLLRNEAIMGECRVRKK